MSLRRIGHLFGAIVAVVGAVFVGSIVVTEFPGALAKIVRIQSGFLVVAMIAFVAQGWITAMAWARLAAARDQPVTVRDAYRAIYAPMLARYMPGGTIWTLAATSAASHRVGVRASVAMLGSTGVIAIAAIGAVMIAATAAIGIPLVALAGLTLVAGAIARFLPGRHAGIASDLVLLGAASWIAAGVGHLAIALSAGVDAAIADRVVAAAAGAWLAGLAAIGVPAGLGVREAAQTLVLRDAVGGEIAVVIALVSRAISIGSDIVASSIAWSLAPKRSDAYRASH